jgi:hypothetical protein
VKPPPVPAEVLLRNITDVLTGDNPELDKYLESGDQQGAATTLLCVASLMNAENEDAEGANSTEASRELYRQEMAVRRSQYINVIANFTVNDTNALEQTNELLRGSVLRSEQVTLDSQVSHMNIQVSEADSVSSSSLKCLQEVVCETFKKIGGHYKKMRHSMSSDDQHFMAEGE